MTNLETPLGSAHNPRLPVLGSGPLADGLRIVGFRAPGSCMIFRLSTNIPAIQPEDEIVLSSQNGEETGRVVFVSHVEPQEKIQERLFAGRFDQITRVVTEKDRKDREWCVAQEKKAKIYCRQKIRELQLPMKLSKTAYQVGGGKVMFYFTAENRIDFRELVRILGSFLKVRVEMRHVGVRDEAKLLQGMGPCGKEFCCSSHLKKFSPVSVRMAKNQELSLNPEGISGVCGRLLCCLSFENQTYSDLRKSLPKPKDKVWTQNGQEATIRNVHPMTEMIALQFNDGTRKSMPNCALCHKKPAADPENPEAKATSNTTPSRSPHPRGKEQKKPPQREITRSRGRSTPPAKRTSQVPEKKEAETESQPTNAPITPDTLHSTALGQATPQPGKGTSAPGDADPQPANKPAPRVKRRRRSRHRRQPNPGGTEKSESP